MNNFYNCYNTDLYQLDNSQIGDFVDLFNLDFEFENSNSGVDNLHSEYPYMELEDQQNNYHPSQNQQFISQQFEYQHSGHQQYEYNQPGNHINIHPDQYSIVEVSDIQASESNEVKQNFVKEAKKDCIVSNLIDREWKCLNSSNEDNFDIKIRSRLEKPSEFLPEKIYCTTKYTLNIHGKSIKEKYKCLFASVELYKVENQVNKIVHNGFEGQVHNIAFCEHKGLYQAKISLKFNSENSIQRSRTKYSLKAKVFTAEKYEIASFESPAFILYARKENKPGDKSNKFNNSKKLKKSNKLMKPNKSEISNIKNFGNELDSLFEIFLSQDFDSLYMKKCQELINIKLVSKLKRM